MHTHTHTHTTHTHTNTHAHTHTPVQQDCPDHELFVGSLKLVWFLLRVSVGCVQSLAAVSAGRPVSPVQAPAFWRCGHELLFIKAVQHFFQQLANVLNRELLFSKVTFENHVQVSMLGKLGHKEVNYQL